ncbi:MAG: S8 family peptidase, partial [Bacteroidota bacterium]
SNQPALPNVTLGMKLFTNSRHQKSEVENGNADSGPFPSSFQLNSLGINHLHAEGNIGQGRLIAFFDGGYLGVDESNGFRHIFNSGRLKDVWNFVSNTDNVYESSTHGTRVFSATAAYEERVFEGAAHGADFMLFVTEDASSEFRVEEYNWLFAAEHADSAGVDIINASVGYYDFDDPSMNYSYEDMDGGTTVITRAADRASAKGMLVVVSAGNEGSRPWQFITAPADADSVLAVGAVDRGDLRSNFSSIGPTADGRIKPNVMALGSSTALITSDGNVTSGSGTSFSSPLIAGLAALLWNENPSLNNIEILNLIQSLGDRSQNPDNQYGYGIPAVLGEPEPATPFDIAVFPNPVGDDELNLVFGVLQSDLEVKIAFYDMLGNLISENNFVATPGFCELSYNIANIPQGAYILQITSSLLSKQLRIIRS